MCVKLYTTHRVDRSSVLLHIKFIISKVLLYVIIDHFKQQQSAVDSITLHGISHAAAGVKQL